MNEEYGNDILTLTDDEGNEIQVEHLSSIEHNGGMYMAFLPATMDLEDSYELIIMKVEKQEGSDEEVLATLTNETELQEVFEIFSQELEEMFEEE